MISAEKDITIRDIYLIWIGTIISFAAFAFFESLKLQLTGELQNYNSWLAAMLATFAFLVAFWYLLKQMTIRQ